MMSLWTLVLSALCLIDGARIDVHGIASCSALRLSEAEFVEGCAIPTLSGVVFAVFRDGELEIVTTDLGSIEDNCLCDEDGEVCADAFAVVDGERLALARTRDSLSLAAQVLAIPQSNID